MIPLGQQAYHGGLPNHGGNQIAYEADWSLPVLGTPPITILRVDLMMNKYIIAIVLFGTFTLASCSPDSNTSTDNSSSVPTASPVQDVEENSSTDVAKTIKEREDYDSVDLNKLPQGVSLTGSDPKEIAIAVFPPPDEEPQEGNFQRDVTVNTVAPTLTSVIITETGLLDDSVNGILRRADFEQSGTDGKSWKMVWTGRQYKCQSGRGSQDWSKKLCS